VRGFVALVDYGDRWKVRVDDDTAVHRELGERKGWRYALTFRSPLCWPERLQVRCDDVARAIPFGISQGEIDRHHFRDVADRLINARADQYLCKVRGSRTLRTPPLERGVISSSVSLR